MKTHASLMFLLSIMLLDRFGTAQALAAPSIKSPAPSAASQAATPSADSATWWKHAVIYEIYPRSFQDSNGDGVGDLNGITQRLDYLKELGVDAVWISPMFPSPQVDFGYDVSDYLTVDPQYGSLADMDRLITEAQKRGIRVCLDWVVNHTSDKHQWFVESASSRTNPKHDWYMWNDGVDASGPGVTAYQRKFQHEGKVPPNNWVSFFGGSAWEWVPAVHQFYYHLFYKQQPDLNWRNPVVEKAMFDGMEFWMKRGVAGFRLDAVPTLFEDPQLRNDPEKGGVNAQGDPNVANLYTVGLPEVHGTVRRMREVVNRYPGAVLIGETYLPSIAELDTWYGGAAKDELQLPMDMQIGFHGDHDKLDATSFRTHLREVETQIHGSQPLIVFDNHDNVRSINRYADGVHDIAIAKLLAAMLLTAKSTAMMYYGEELGMPTTTPTRVEDVRDPIGITGWPKEKGRDGERTPMQWSGSNAQAGFSTNPHPWLPVPDNYKSVNVETERADPASLLNWHRQLIALRRQMPALHDGAMTFIDTGNKDVLSYVRTGPAGTASVVISLNMSAQPQTLALDLASAGVTGTQWKTLLSSDGSLAKASSLRGLVLAPYGSCVGEVR